MAEPAEEAARRLRDYLQLARPSRTVDACSLFRGMAAQTRLFRSDSTSKRTFEQSRHRAEGFCKRSRQISSAEESRSTRQGNCRIQPARRLRRARRRQEARAMASTVQLLRFH